MHMHAILRFAAEAEKT